MSSRRNFFRQLMGRSMSLWEEARGRPQHAAHDLRSLPDDLLDQVVPRLRQECRIEVQEEQVLALGPAEGSCLVVCGLQDRILTVFNLFKRQPQPGDGDRPLRRPA